MFYKILLRRRKLETEVCLKNFEKFYENLRGEIILSHCKGHDTIIIFFVFTDIGHP